MNLQKKIQDESLISTVPPYQDGTDPVIQKYKQAISSNNKKIIYLSATSVYGGGIVYEETKPNPQNIRGKTRLKAETEWLTANNKSSIFRISGIYGPGRHPMIKYLNGNDEVIVKSGHVSNRVNVEDLSAIVIKYLTENYNYKYLNISDDNKIQSYDAIKYVTEKLNLNLPKAISYQSNKVSEAMKSFYEVDRVVKSKFIGNEFNYQFKNLDYKEALLKLTKKLMKVT
jgi:dTDP-4-dehydrorhamnose reductase